MNWSEAVILFKYTSRSRPENFERGLKSIIDNAERPDRIVFVITIDQDDPKFSEYSKICVNNGWYGNDNVFYYGDSVASSNKIEAINRHVNTFTTHWDILVNMSDDMVFTAKGFDDIIRQAFADHFPDGDGFVHFSDGKQHGNVSTMSIMDRKYYERRNYIYNPLYKSVWCDVEATDEAYALGRYKYMGDRVVIFNHLHPAWGLAQYDEQYRKSENLDVWGEDLKTVIQRKSNGYDLNLPISSHKYSEADMRNWKIELNNARTNAGMEPITF